MSETQTVIRVQSELWQQFKGRCIARGTSPTAIINNLIWAKVREWEDEEQREAIARHNTRKMQELS